MKRYDLINWFIERYDYKTYLEIGLDQPKNCFDRIECVKKYSVDPKIQCSRSTHYQMTSDDYFKFVHDGKLDIVFVDGLHVCDQVIKDITNSLQVLSEIGTIIVHDCNPQKEIEANPQRQTGRWNGDVWKAFAFFRKNFPNLFMKTVNIDEGCGIIRYGTQKTYNGPYLEYSDLETNRSELLQLISPKDLECYY